MKITSSTDPHIPALEPVYYIETRPSYTEIISVEEINPSAPSIDPTNEPLNPDSACEIQLYHTINWDELPVTEKHSWWQSETIVGIAKKTLPVTKYSLGGLALLAPVPFLFITATPLVLIGGASAAVAGFACSSFGCHKAQQGLESVKIDSVSNRKLKRLHIKESLENGKGYSYLKTIEGGLEPFITIEELNKILTIDIERMNYAEFMNKHGREVSLILNDPNKEILKRSLLNFSARELTLLDLSRYYANDLLFLSLNKEIVESLIINREILAFVESTYSYSQLIDRNGTQILKHFKQTPYEAKVSEELHLYMLDKHLGCLDIQTKYNSHFNYFDFNPCSIVAREFLKLEREEITYKTFKQENGLSNIIEAIKATIISKESLLSIFEKLPYESLTSSEYEEDRLFFGLEDKAVKAILTKRWMEQPLKKLLKKETGFLQSLEKDTEFKKEEWREKALQEIQTLSVVAIANDYPQLFQSGILDCESAMSAGPSIAERLEKEISTIQRLEDLQNRFPNVLFEYEILHKNSPKVAELVTSYLRQNIYTLLSSTTKQQVEIFIEKYRLMPDEVGYFYKITHSKLDALKKDISISMHEVKETCHNMICKNIHTKETQIRPFLNSVEEKREALKRLKQTYRWCEEEINSLKIRKQKLEKNNIENTSSTLQIEQTLFALEKEAFLLSNSLLNYEQALNELQTAKKELDHISNKIDTDSTRLELSQTVLKLREEEHSYSKQEKVKNEAIHLRQQVDAFQEEIKELDKEVCSDEFTNKKQELLIAIADIKDILNKPVTGLGNAFGAIAKRYIGSSKEEAELNILLQKEKSLPEKKQELQHRLTLLKEKELEVSKIDPNVTVLLLECQKSLQIALNKQREQEVSLKNRLQFTNYEFKVQSLSAHLQDLDRKKIECFTLDQKINKAKQTQTMLRNSKEQFEIELKHIQINLVKEEYKKTELSSELEQEEKELASVEQKYNEAKDAAEKEYKDKNLSLEIEKKSKLQELDQELNQKTAEIIQEFKDRF